MVGPILEKLYYYWDWWIAIEVGLTKIILWVYFGARVVSYLVIYTQTIILDKYRSNAQLTKKKKRCYVYNIFTINYRWLVVISSNLKLTLRLLFYPNNNNLSLKLCYKNIVDISFLNHLNFRGHIMSGYLHHGCTYVT